MDLLTRTEDGRLMFRMAALSLAALILAAALALAITAYVNRALANTCCPRLTERASGALRSCTTCASAWGYFCATVPTMPA